MKTLFRVTTLAALVAASGWAVSPLFAQDPSAPGGPGMHRRGPGGPGGPLGGFGDIGRGLRQLDLTDAQREQVRGITQARQADFRAVGERLRTAQQALEAAIVADNVDEAAIRARSADVAAVQADAAVLRARVHQEVFSLLTAEQQAKAKELRAQREQRMKERESRMRERRPRQPAPQQ